MQLTSNATTVARWGTRQINAQTRKRNSNLMVHVIIVGNVAIKLVIADIWRKIKVNVQQDGKAHQKALRPFFENLCPFTHDW